MLYHNVHEFDCSSFQYTTLCLKKTAPLRQVGIKSVIFQNFVGNFILNKSCTGVLLWWCHYDVIYRQLIRWCRHRMRSVMNSMRLFVVLLPWKPCSWYLTRTKLFELIRSATEWRCLVWKIIMGELILMNLCQPALVCKLFWDTM